MTTRERTMMIRRIFERGVSVNDSESENESDTGSDDIRHQFKLVSKSMKMCVMPTTTMMPTMTIVSRTSKMKMRIWRKKFGITSSASTSTLHLYLHTFLSVMISLKAVLLSILILLLSTRETASYTFQVSGSGQYIQRLGSARTWNSRINHCNCYRYCYQRQRQHLFRYHPYQQEQSFPNSKLYESPSSPFEDAAGETSHSHGHSNSNINSIDLNYLDNSRPDNERRPRRLTRKKKSKQRSSSSQHQVQHEHENEHEHEHHEHKHKHERKHRHQTQTHHRLTSKERKFSQWGVQKHDQKDTVCCPSTVHSVAKECFHAISSTLYCRNFLDPNIASNAMAVSVTDKRPVGFAYWPEGRDVGRLGVEIDNARFLIMDPKSKTKFGSGGARSGAVSSSNSSSSTSTSTSTSTSSSSNRNRNSNSSTNHHKAKFAEVEGRALRRVVLLLASKLSQMPWYGLEDDNDEDDEDDDYNKHEDNILKYEQRSDTNYRRQQQNGQYERGSSNKKTRPVAIFFNTISQALLASRELQLLRQIALHQNLDTSSYNNIRILCLGKDTIPDDMIKSKRGGTKDNKSKVNSNKNNKGRRKWGSSRELSSGKVDPKLGMVIVVQPTDYNFELNPPGPTVGTIQELQKLLSRASVNQIPSIVVSPRLMEQYEGRAGIEQSGYQQSSTYGGLEPPRGPTPWLLRDFIPPVYSWIGCALEISSRRPSPFVMASMANEEQRANRNEQHNLDYEYRYYSRVAMYQTVMESGHPWHLFAVKNDVHVSASSRNEKCDTSYEYIVSTNAHSGRPSRDLLKDVLSEFI